MFVCKIITTDLLACVNYPEVKNNFNFDVLISNLSFHSTFVILIWLVTICSLIRRFFFWKDSSGTTTARPDTDIQGVANSHERPVSDMTTIMKTTMNGRHNGAELLTIAVQSSNGDTDYFFGVLLE